MKIKCLKCGRAIPVGTYWLEVACPGCAVAHHRLARQRSWSWAGEPENWVCSSCEEEFEVQQPEAAQPQVVVAHCPRCRARNVRQESFIQPVAEALS
jgi:DNA-directed RNA polymerase subunit RPC12/RpoP